MLGTNQITMMNTLFITIFVSVKLYDHNFMPFIVAVFHYNGHSKAFKRIDVILPMAVINELLLPVINTGRRRFRKSSTILNDSEQFRTFPTHLDELTHRWWFLKCLEPSGTSSTYCVNFTWLQLYFQLLNYWNDCLEFNIHLPVH